MQHLTSAIPYILGAILAATLLTAIGSITSRFFKYSFAYLSFLSFGVYVMLGYMVSKDSNLSIAILSALVVGFYDATVCWRLSLLLKANLGLPAEDVKKLTVTKSLTIMLFVAPFFAFIGSLFKP